jgi:hypothetical protein
LGNDVEVAQINRSTTGKPVETVGLWYLSGTLQVHIIAKHRDSTHGLCTGQSPERLTS